MRLLINKNYPKLIFWYYVLYYALCNTQNLIKIFIFYLKYAEYINSFRLNIKKIVKSVFQIEREEGDKVVSLLTELKPLSDNDCFILLILLETMNLNKILLSDG